jgi:hypothetical protein
MRLQKSRTTKDRIRRHDATVLLSTKINGMQALRVAKNLVDLPPSWSRQCRLSDHNRVPRPHKACKNDASVENPAHIHRSTCAKSASLQTFRFLSNIGPASIHAFSSILEIT